MKKISFAVSESSMAYIVIGNDGDYIKSGYNTLMHLTRGWLEELAAELDGAVLVWVGDMERIDVLSDALAQQDIVVSLAGQVNIPMAQVQRQQANVICTIGTIMYRGQRIFENDTKFLATAGAMLQERNTKLKEQIEKLETQTA